MTLTESVKSFFKKPLIYLSTTAVLTTACYGGLTFRDIEYKDNKPAVLETRTYQGNGEDRTFIGRPVQLEHNGDNLEFIMKSYDDQDEKLFRIDVHEDGDYSNKKNLEMIEGWIEESLKDPTMEFRVQGLYNRDFSRGEYEEGDLNPYVIIKMTQNDSTGAFEEAVWTDKKDSPIYTNIDVDIVLGEVYYPGHHIWLTHYPIGIYPFWDSDGDGIPNQWDPWPYKYGPWVDFNHNHVWDWYDPFYDALYWGYWNNHYPHHDFRSEWKEYYKHDFKNNHDFKDRNRESIKIRNNLNGRNPGNKDLIRNPGDRNPIIKRDPIKERDQIKDRDKIQDRDPIRNKDPIKERDPINDRNPKDKELIKRERENTIDDKVNTRDKERNTNTERDQYKKPEYKQPEERKRQEQIDKDRSPPVKRQDVERKTYERQTETRTYTPPKNNYQPPRTYTPPKQNNPPRQNVTPPRNNTPPKNNTTPRSNTTPRNNTNNTQKTRDRK